jgi:hypothetical protein
MIHAVVGELNGNNHRVDRFEQYIFGDNVNAEIRGSIFYLQNMKEWIS